MEEVLLIAAVAALAFWLGLMIGIDVGEYWERQGKDEDQDQD